MAVKIDRTDREKFAQIGSRIPRKVHSEFRIALLKNDERADETVTKLIKNYVKNGLPACTGGLATRVE